VDRAEKDKFRIRANGKHRRWSFSDVKPI